MIEQIKKLFYLLEMIHLRGLEILHMLILCLQIHIKEETQQKEEDKGNHENGPTGKSMKKALSDFRAVTICEDAGYAYAQAIGKNGNRNGRKKEKYPFP